MKNIKGYDSFVNEEIKFIDKIFNKDKKINKNLISEIDQILENGDKDEMIDFIRSIADKTKYPDTVKVDLLKELSDKGEYRANPEDILYTLKKYLEKNDLKDIRIYGPNHGLSTWMITNTDASFSG